jgi:predicted homoserine dehydrogenase-like protein
MAGISYILQELKKREKNSRPINVAVMGTGWFGSGVVQELCRCPGVRPKLVLGLTSSDAADCLRKAGVPRQDICAPQSSDEFRQAMSANRYIACASNEYTEDWQGIDVFFEATGNILAGAQAALKAIAQKIHFVTIGAELDATVGYILSRKAARQDVVYSNCDGDQPGVLARIIDEVRLTGFDVVVAGNCKGFIDVHKTPEDIRPWIKPGHNPRMITAFTDGTKQGLELAVVANAARLGVDIRGMHGITTSKDNIVDAFMSRITNPGVVDYVLGINGVNQGGGVFVIGKREGNRIEADMEYLKKGKGPYYLFFKDEHLCYFSAVTTIASAVLLQTATSVPAGKYADVFTAAKRGLKSGERCDGIGGFMTYGVIDNSENVKREDLLPVGLSEFAVLKKDAAADTPLSYSMVDFVEDNIIIKLRQEQDALTGQGQKFCEK